MMLFLSACFSNTDSTIVNSTALEEDTSEIVEYFSLAEEVVVGHIDSLQIIADNNSNNRAIGTSGGAETRAYIQTILRELGYEVWSQPVELSYYDTSIDPIVRLENDQYEASVFYYSGSGDIIAPIEPVDVEIPPGDNANSSTSGCQTEDFVGFNPGSIALIQRGSCNFIDKVRNAESAGAVGVVIFNEGQNGRRGIVEGTLGEEGTAIPVVGISFDSGEILSENVGSDVQLQVESEMITLTTENIFAELSSGDENNIVLVGGHLDSVFAGPGINDNGTGTAAILSIADWLVQNQLSIKNRIRFAWWGAEEVGLIGSSYFVQNSPDEVAKIRAYLNFDMLGSPNFARFIYDGDGSSFGVQGPGDSGMIEGLFEDYFGSLNLQVEATAFDGRSDYGPFVEVGVPSGGLFSGAEAIMTQSQSSKFEGVSGVAFDECYHQGCDSKENINWDGLHQMADAILNVTLQLSEVEEARIPASNSPSIRLPYKGHRLRY